MHFQFRALSLETLLSPLARAEDELARLDEAIGRSCVGPGFIARGHFGDAAACMWLAGSLVHIEDLVLHDAHMDIRAPTHELTRAHAILQARRRIADAPAGWCLSPAGFALLTGMEKMPPPVHDPAGRVQKGEDNDPLTDAVRHLDAVLGRSSRVLAGLGSAPRQRVEQVSDPVDPMGDEREGEPERLMQWQILPRQLAHLPPLLATALLFDAWQELEPLPRRPWLGGVLACGYLRARGKARFHLPALHMGLKMVQANRLASQDQTQRIAALLEACTAMAEAGLKELARLSLVRELMERKLKGRRASSHLPQVIELFLSHPVISAAMVAKIAHVTPRAALNLIGELGVREITGRGRYRAWSI